MTYTIITGADGYRQVYPITCSEKWVKKQQTAIFGTHGKGTIEIKTI